MEDKPIPMVGTKHIFFDENTGAEWRLFRQEGCSPFYWTLQPTPDSRGRTMEAFMGRANTEEEAIADAAARVVGL